MIRVGMSFYTKGGEQTVWEQMPQVPQAGDTVHYSLSGDPDESRAWRVMHVSWVRDTSWLPGMWHAEIGLD